MRMVSLSFNPYQWLEGRIKFGVKEGLENISEVLSRLDNPHQKYTSALIAGTNGKGYTTSLSAKLLDSSGIKVGWFISPHLVNVRERIRIGNQVISSESFTEITHQVSEACQQFSLTYFEALTAIASQYFSQENVDIAIFEVGLGGRLDSTNIHNAQYSVVTSIGLDHADFLGNDLNQILLEKCGVMRSGQKSYVQLTQPELRKRLLEINQSKKTQLNLLPLEFLGMPQGHFKRNAQLALEWAQDFCLDRGVQYSLERWQHIVSTHQWDGRQQKVTDPILSKIFDTIILDGAHNPESFQELTHLLKGHEYPGLIVVGLMADKELSGIFQCLSELEGLGWRIAFTQGSFPRFAQASELQQSYSGDSIIVNFNSLLQGDFSTPIDKSENSRAIVLCGSLYFMGEFVLATSDRIPELSWYQQFDKSSNEMIGMPR